MIRHVLLTATALTAISAGAAYADCTARMEAVNEEYGEFFAEERRTSAADRTVVFNLRSAAGRLVTEGNDEGCVAVVDAMEKVLASYRDMDETPTGDQAEAAQKTEGEQPSATAENQEEAERMAAEAERVANLSEEERNAERRAEIEARLVELKEGALVDTSDLLGVNVYNYKDEFLGEIDGMLVKTGSAPSHMIVGHGGIFSIGDKEVAIPIDAFKWDPEWEVFYVNMTNEQLDNAPDYDMSDGKWVQDANDSYFKELMQN